MNTPSKKQSLLEEVLTYIVLYCLVGTLPFALIFLIVKFLFDGVIIIFHPIYQTYLLIISLPIVFLYHEIRKMGATRFWKRWANQKVIRSTWERMLGEKYYRWLVYTLVFGIAIVLGISVLVFFLLRPFIEH